MIWIAGEYGRKHMTKDNILNLRIEPKSSWETIVYTLKIEQIVAVSKLKNMAGKPNLQWNSMYFIEMYKWASINSSSFPNSQNFGLITHIFPSNWSSTEI